MMLRYAQTDFNENKKMPNGILGKEAEMNLYLALEFDKKRISWYNIPTIISKSKEAIK